MVNQGGNGGLHFRIPNGTGYKGGYEAAINCTHGVDQKRTGSIYSLDGGPMLFINPQPLVPPNTWFRMEVIAVGSRIQVLVNGRVVTDITDPTHRFPKGHLGIEHNGNPTAIFYRNLEVKELPPSR
jgi:hypothetical protein